jgi:hypothetical protein
VNGGFNASYGQGVYARSNNSFNLNYRVNKINFFTNLSYNINNSFQDLYIERAYFKPNTNTLNTTFNQNSFIKREATGFTGKIGFDYYINKKSTVGLVLNGFSNETNNTTTMLNYMLVPVSIGYDGNQNVKEIKQQNLIRAVKLCSGTHSTKSKRMKLNVVYSGF